MKKKIFALLFAVLLCALTLIPVSAEGEEFVSVEGVDYSKFAGTVLNVYNWGEYISDGAEDSLNVNKRFEELTGIKVIYANYESNESMYAKLKQGGTNYDVIIPSDYMIERLITENMLEELDFSKIPNYANIYDRYKNLYYDPDNKYSVPYSVGMVGIIYNTTMVSKTVDSWSILWDTDYSNQILQFNNPRDAFMTAQFLLGIDVNTTDEAELKKTADKLKEQKDIIQSYVMDEVFNILEGGTAAIGSYYAGDYLTMYEVNSDLAFVYPKEGTNIFVDAVCIPKGAEHKEAAELYINYLLSEEAAVANAEAICYASPNKKVVENTEYIESMKELHPDVMNILYPETVSFKTEYYHNLPNATLQDIDKLWNDVKSKTNDWMIVLICGVLVAIIAGFFIYRYVVKKKRENA